MFPRAERAGERGLSLVEVVVALAISSMIGLGLWQAVRSTYAVARQNEAKLDTSEQVATLLRRVGDAAAAMERGSRVAVGPKGVSFVTKVFKNGASRPASSTVRNQCVKARYAGFDPSVVAVSPAWKTCTGAPRCAAGSVPTIVFEGAIGRSLNLPATSQPSVGAQRLIGAYFCATASSPDQVLLTIVDVRTGETGAQALVTGQRSLAIGYNTRLSERVQLFLPGEGVK